MERTKNAGPSSDAIVDEVRAVRADLSAQFNDDVESLCAHPRRIETQYPDRMVGPRRRKAAGKRRAASGAR